MNTLDFVTRLGAALLLGCLVGLERQWRQRMTGMRTNSLVSVGSALFVMMGSLISGGDSEGRVASYVVSGIGFLGGGVILKDGFNIRGLNTAATLWCTAAVGTLAGTGHLLFAAIGALAVVLMNLVLRPLANLINSSPADNGEQEILYRFRCTCRTSDESHVRALLLQNVERTPLALLALHSKDDEHGNLVNVKAFLKAIGRKDEALEQIVSRLSLEPSVTTIAWEVVASVDAEEDPILASHHLVQEEVAR